MATPAKQATSTCNLLDLPDEIISTISTKLTEPDKINFIAVCRKAARLTMQAAECTLKITKGTMFAGIKKVLDTIPAQIHLQIICPTIHKRRKKSVNDVAASAMDVFMGMVPDSHLLTEIASKCNWEGITKVTIHGTMMRCLVPQFIALACPQLQQLKIMMPKSDDYNRYAIFNTTPEDALPLTACPSLRQLEVNDISFRTNELALPSRHHSAAELHQHLPNIDTLVMQASNAAALLQAFATQLTRLETVRSVTDTCQEPFRRCSSLRHLSISGFTLPDNTAALKVLHINGYESCSDDHLKMLLALPSLSKLWLYDLNLKQDWTDHACSWQELHLARMSDFTTVANLCVRSLKKLTMGSSAAINLPCQSEATSLAALQRAVDNLAHVGQIEIEQRQPNARAYFGECGVITWDVLDRGSEHEKKAAELIRVAGQRVGPCKVCNCVDSVKRPTVLDAVFSWGKDFMESVCLGDYYNTQLQIWEALQQQAYLDEDFVDSVYIDSDCDQTQVWKALQQLKKLNTVVLWHNDSVEVESDDEWMYYQALKICSAVLPAAQHYVIPTNTSLRMEFGYNNVVKQAGTESLEWLQERIEEFCPSGSEVSSVEFVSLEGNDLYTQYGHLDGLRDIDAFWVVMIEPTQTTA